MAEVIRMPRMSDTMEEGVIAEWHKKVGDTVKSGELMADVETDKATMELESYVDGTLLYIGVEKGKAVKVNGILAIVGKPGEDYKALLEKESAQPAEAKAEAPAAKPVEAEKQAATAKQEPAKQEPAKQPAPQPVAAANGGDASRLKASPLARNIAKDKGIDLEAVKGSGDDGRIVKRDIENFQPAVNGAKTAPQPAFTLPAVVGEESF